MLENKDNRTEEEHGSDIQSHLFELDRTSGEWIVFQEHNSNGTHEQHKWLPYSWYFKKNFLILDKMCKRRWTKWIYIDFNNMKQWEERVPLAFKNSISRGNLQDEELALLVYSYVMSSTPRLAYCRIKITKNHCKSMLHHGNGGTCSGL